MQRNEEGRFKLQTYIIRIISLSKYNVHNEQIFKYPQTIKGK